MENVGPTLDGAVIGAILGLLGVIITQLIIGFTRKKEYEFEKVKMKQEWVKNENEHSIVERDQYLQSLKTTVDILKSDYDRLVKEVDALREDVRKKEKDTRLVLERYSVALTYIGYLLSHEMNECMQDETRREELLATVPNVIQEDFFQRWPERTQKLESYD